MDNYTSEILDDAQRNAERNMASKKMSKLEKAIVIAALAGIMISFPLALKDCQKKLARHANQNYSDKVQESYIPK